MEPEDDDDFQVWVLFHSFMVSFNVCFQEFNGFDYPLCPTVSKGAFLNPSIGRKY